MDGDERDILGLPSEYTRSHPRDYVHPSLYFLDRSI